MHDPITPQHPLLELAMRIGFVFDDFGRPRGECKRVYYHLLADGNRMCLTVFENGRWVYEDGALVVARQAYVTTEQEFNALLHDTLAEVYLRRHKLRVLAAQLAS